MGKSVVISAPSGAGKTSIVNYLLNEIVDLEFSISACNRAKRHNEVDGEHYHFLETIDFKKKISEGFFLEWEEVYENQFYGTLFSTMNEIWSRDKHVIFDVDVKGAINIKKKYLDECLSIFISPPSIKSLEERLLNRGTDSKDNIKKRLNKAKKELEFKDHFDTIIINEDFSEACLQARKKVLEFLNK